MVSGWETPSLERREVGFFNDFSLGSFLGVFRKTATFRMPVNNLL
jgi:hypothetical protein